ncbi:MAG: adenosine deaminase family protein, partial [Nocardioidaceae bacterium]
ATTFGGITAFTDLVLDAARQAEQAAGIGIGVVIAANRTRHPLDARTLARLAAKYAGRGVVGFGLSNDERRGVTEEFEAAFSIARRAGLASMPHGGELRGADSVARCLSSLGADRIGHGVRCVEDSGVLDRVVRSGATLEVCPTSNVSLGVYSTFEEVPVRPLIDAGVGVALGADDPLLFGSRLADQYTVLRVAQEFTDAELAGLARTSLRASYAPASLVSDALDEIDRWLAAPDECVGG